ncbi:hypothetical protein SCHPADRAFT_941212 [Schizopora paradoxa]|uniref:Uncharacterized protein n=1 Tax=Schizopora paradoxa TaxID=27342 RepID=A0A0H2RLM2_9AGAM|nr:hypothetical protein SCHPADRAFT_941212 [Schizopora paradoxa]
MSREVQLTYPRLRLFRNCILTTPSGRAEYSVSTRWNKGFAGRTTTIYALCPSLEESIDEKSAYGFNEYAPLGGSHQPPANVKTVVAEINFRFPYRRHLTVEVPNRQRLGTAAVGPMRRNLQDLFIPNANGESVILDIGGKFCECFWVRKDRHTRELRVLATGALVAAFRDEKVGFVDGQTLSPSTHMTIHTDVVAKYIANAYSDRTPRIFAATTMQQDVLDEVLVAYLLYRHLRCRSIFPEIVKKSASLLKSLFCLGKSDAATFDDLDSGKLLPQHRRVPSLRHATTY